MIVIDNKSNIPLHQQIYEQLKEQIITEQISEGSKLPSTRMLSTTLNVSRNTVDSAYQQLSSEGYIVSKPGSGFISIKLSSMEILRPASEDFKNIKEIKKKVQGVNPNSNYKYDFCYGSLNTPDFPLIVWKKLSNKCMSAVGPDSFTSYQAQRGELGLQIELMEYLSKSRGVCCKPEQIIISSGMDYCLNMLCQLFRRNLDQIAIEDPGYTGAREIFINNGYKVIPISLEGDGINVKELDSSSAKIVYVTPSHQFPTGLVMPIQKRLKLLDWAIRNQGFIIEDDYDSEFRYNSRPIPSLQGIDSMGCVVYIGTFSKSLSPSLRLNYMVLPEALVESYERLFSRYQVPVPFIQQKIVEQFMHLGYWDRHLRKVYLTVKRKHDTLIHAIHEHMGDKVVIHGENSGLHILLEFNNGLKEEELIEKAKKYGVHVSPVSIFWMRPEKYSNNMILIGFGGMPEGDIEEGIKTLKYALLND